MSCFTVRVILPNFESTIHGHTACLIYIFVRRTKFNKTDALHPNQRAAAVHEAKMNICLASLRYAGELCTAVSKTADVTQPFFESAGCVRN